MDMVKRIQKCLVCNHVIFSSNKISVGRKYFYLRCNFCTSGLIQPLPNQSQLKKYYHTQDYYMGLSKKVRNLCLQKIFSVQLYKTYGDWVNSHFNKKGVVLDVGPGNGEFLAELKNVGWDVWGSDFSMMAAKNTSQKIGDNRIKVGQFYRQNWTKSFDLITFWHVLEHTREPQKYMRKSYKILKNGGRIFGEVPNFDSPWLWLFKDRYAWIMVPVHVIYFSPQSVRYLLEKAGYKNIEVHTPPRALLNFALSVNKNPIISGLLSPLSVIFGLLLSLLGKGEVVRFTASK